MLKDIINCDITHVVTCLSYEIRTDYKDFFFKEGYENTTIEMPVSFNRVFALFFESGIMQLMFAASDYDYSVWTDAFKKMIR